MQVRSYFLLGILFNLGYAAKVGRPRTVKNCGTVNVPLQAGITNGSLAQPGEYPWMVSIQEDFHGFRHACGGAILNEHWIITTTGCLFEPDKPWRYKVYVGVHNLLEEDFKPSKKYKVSKIILHKDQGNSKNGGVLSSNDIALLRTTEPIDMRNSRGYVNGVCLPLDDEDPTGWAFFTRYGNSEEVVSDVLRVYKVPIIPRDVCSDGFDKDPDYAPENSVSDKVLCAGEDDMGSCGLPHNDLGSPLVQRNEEGVYTLIGVVSYYVGCTLGDHEFHPLLYTKVASYMDWLYENMKDS